ncbi:ribonuclease VapC [Synergistales bacterium]|nr:ribonuclease VapC [Synergistales bacterium]
MVIDTDVLIWFFRGNLNAVSALDEIPVGERFISVITYMELLQGMRNKTELRIFQEIFEYSELIVLPLNRDIGNIACQYLEQFHLTSGLRIEDALIAATATTYNMELFSGNYKHFKDLKIPLKRFYVI